GRTSISTTSSVGHASSLRFGAALPDGPRISENSPRRFTHENRDSHGSKIRMNSSLGTCVVRELPATERVFDVLVVILGSTLGSGFLQAIKPVSFTAQPSFGIKVPFRERC